MKSHATVRRGNKTIPTAPTRPREEAMCRSLARVIGIAVFPAFAWLAPASAEPPRLPVPTVDQSAVAQRGYFYVGGKYVGEPGKEIMQGQTYVEVLAPKDVRRPYPLVLSMAPRRPPPTGWERRTAARAGPSISSSRAMSST
jgi:hypothetical protein